MTGDSGKRAPKRAPKLARQLRWIVPKDAQRLGCVREALSPVRLQCDCASPAEARLQHSPMRDNHPPPLPIMSACGWVIRLGSSALFNSASPRTLRSKATWRTVLPDLNDSLAMSAALS